MQTQSYPVAGMTCRHCVNAVTEELKRIGGVTDVMVELTPEGVSTVRMTSAEPVDSGAVRAALDEAGDYRLAWSPN